MADATIFHRLKQDHDSHRQLFKKMDDAQGDDDRLKKLFDQFKVEVTAHAAAEEETLYATMLARPDLREDAQHSVSEHKEIDDYLEEMEEQDFNGKEWRETFAQLKKRYLHHIDEEEEEMFPEAEKDLSEAKKQELLAIFEKEKPKEKAKAAEEEPSSEHERA